MIAINCGRPGLRGAVHLMHTAACLLFLTLSLSLSSSCSGGKDAIPESSDTVAVPFQEFGRSTLFSYDGTIKLWRLETDYMRKELSDTAHMLAVPVKITQYDSAGNANSLILADSAHTRDGLDSFFIWGDVYVRTQDDLIIRSESLWWNKLSHKVGSEDYVKITTPAGDVLRGKGLDATESFSNWTLRENVSGWFPNFRERAETEEEEPDEEQ